MSLLSDILLLIAEVTRTRLRATIREEGRELRASVADLLIGFVAMLGALLVAIAGFGMLVWGLYAAIASAAPQWAAAFLCAFVLLILAGLLFAWAKHLAR